MTTISDGDVVDGGDCDPCPAKRLTTHSSCRWTAIDTVLAGDGMNDVYGGAGDGHAGRRIPVMTSCWCDGADTLNGGIGDGTRWSDGPNDNSGQLPSPLTFAGQRKAAFPELHRSYSIRIL